MAILSITSANVRPGAGAVEQKVTAGGTITGGMPAYRKASDGKYYAGDANIGAEEAAIAGIAMTNAGADEEFFLQTEGELTTGGTMTVGQLYMLGILAGEVRECVDHIAGSFPTTLYAAKSATVATLQIASGGVVHA